MGRPLVQRSPAECSMSEFDLKPQGWGGGLGPLWLSSHEKNNVDEMCRMS